jgi:hypothetical protein
MKPLLLIFFGLLFTVFYSCEEPFNLIEPEPYSGIIFEKSIGGQLDDIGYEAIIYNEEVYIIGTSGSFGEPNGDHYSVKMDLEGNVI